MPDHPLLKFRLTGCSRQSEDERSGAVPNAALSRRSGWLDRFLDPSDKPLSEGSNSPNTLPSIVVIEDDGDIARGLAFMLSGAYTVETAERGSLALELVARTQPDLLLVDHQLPDTNGIALISELRQRGVTARAIMISAYENQREASLAAGFETFLLKPWENGELVWQIEHALARSA